MRAVRPGRLKSPVKATPGMRWLLPVLLVLAGCIEDDTVEARIDGVAFTEAPDSAGPGAAVQVCWRVEGEGAVPHTAVHYDDASHPDAGFSAYPGAAYPTGERPTLDRPTRTAAPFDLPGEWCTEVTLPEEGMLYLRAHAMVEPPGVVSEEIRVEVV